MKRRSLLALPAIAAAQFGPRKAPSFAQIEARIRKWATDHPALVTLTVPAKSVQGRPVFALQLTDRETDPATKEHFLLTALHAGQELSGALGALHIMGWLLSGDPQAREMLRRQVIMCMPVPNPDVYEDPDRTNGLLNAVGEDPYTGWTVDGPRNPAKCPEAVAVQQVMDRLQAEVHGDVHGNSLPYPGAYQGESSSRAYSNVTLRPFHSQITRLMDAAALEEGFPSDELEEDAERLFGGTELGMEREKLWAGIQTAAGGGVVISKPRVYAAIYGYNRYHTMPIATEVGWERSALLRYRRLLQVGNEIWPGERYPGYPVRVIMKNGYDMVTAYGTTAEARRRSRIELWNRQTSIAHGMNRPWAQGRIVYVCATSAAARAKWLSDRTLDGFAKRMREHPQMHADRITRLLDGFPRHAGQWGPTANMMMDGGSSTTDGEPIVHGLCCRLRLPFPKASKPQIWMNGQPLAESETNGYSLWRSRGFTNVAINIPPERSKREDFFVVTCEYDPGEVRAPALDW